MTGLPAPLFHLSGSRSRPFWGRLRLPSLVWAAAVVPAILVILPGLYLLLRTVEGGIPLVDVWLRPAAWQTLLRTMALSAAVTLGSLVLALPMAWLTVRTDLPGRKIWAVLTALPMVIPSYIAAYLFVAFLGPRGMLAQWLSQWTAIERLPSLYGFSGAFLVLTLLCYPLVLINIRTALHGLDPALEEAARGMGLTPRQVFWRVILPQLRPAAMAGSLLTALYVLRDFGAVSILRYDTFTRVIYIQYKAAFDRVSASSLALLLMVLTLILVILESRLRGKARYQRAATGAARPVGISRLGNWRWPALIFCGAVVLLALALPVGVLGYWLVRGLGAGEQIPALLSAAANTLGAATLAALVTLVAGLPVAYVSVRKPGRWSAWLERLTYSGYALPGIVAALSLVFLASQFMPGLYQTLPLLITAYLILFVPQAVGAIRASLLQIHPVLEESARGLGHSPWQVLRRVTLPLARSGLLAGFGLVFLTSAKELPATLILSPLGFKTLATGVWSAVSEAYFAQAAAPALLLVLLSALPLAFFSMNKSS